MKRKAIVSLSAVVPVAALAVASVMAHPPQAMASGIASSATIASVKGANPDWRVRIISPVTFTVSDKVAPSGILAATASEAAALLDN